MDQERGPGVPDTRRGANARLAGIRLRIGARLRICIPSFRDVERVDLLLRDWWLWLQRDRIENFSGRNPSIPLRRDSAHRAAHPGFPPPKPPADQTVSDSGRQTGVGFPV